MLCCPKCFFSELLRKEIVQRGQLGSCDFCGLDGQPCVTTESLRTQFNCFMSAYHPALMLDALGINAPSLIHNLASVMQKDGVLLFSDELSIDRRNSLLDAILGFPAGKSSQHWTSALERITPLGLRGGWNAFRDHVKHRRRYVVKSSDIEDFDLSAELGTRNSHFCEEASPVNTFFRARLHDGGTEHRRLQFSEVEAPPPEICKAGRANAAGIRVLYVADSAETAIAEIRPHIGAVVSVGQFRPRRRMNVFDLSKPPSMAALDPFCEGFAKEMRTAAFFAKLNEEFSRPIPPFAPERDYAPTQIVAEFIAEHGFAGVKYRSAMRPDGCNYVFFDCAELETVAIETFKVREVRVTSTYHDPEWMRNSFLRCQERMGEIAPIDRTDLERPNSSF